jgi:predicted dithiol-disulfide oxidoreductase (DUF899 family)
VCKRTPVSEQPLSRGSLRASEGPSWIAFAREDGAVYHTYTVMAPDPFAAPYHAFLLERTPKTRPGDPQAWRKDEYPD